MTGWLLYAGLSFAVYSVAVLLGPLSPEHAGDLWAGTSLGWALGFLSAGRAGFRPLWRPACWIVGHRNSMWSLPEDEFGLYAYSRLFCSRCEKTFSWRPGFER